MAVSSKYNQINISTITTVIIITIIIVIKRTLVGFILLGFATKLISLSAPSDDFHE